MRFICAYVMIYTTFTERRGGIRTANYLRRPFLFISLVFSFSKSAASRSCSGEKYCRASARHFVHSSAPTTLQAQINALLAQIAALQGNTGTTASVSFTRDLTLGATGSDVTALQNWLISKGYTIAAGATGYFGAQTVAAVAKYQAANGIAPAAGYFGPTTRAHVNAASAGTGTGTGTGTGSTGALKGGAGDLEVSTTGTDVKSTVKESSTENILGLDVEAEGSDVALTNVRVKFQKTAGAGSSRLDRFFDEVAIIVDGDEVGSADAADFSKSGSTFSRNIALKNAVVRDGKEVKLYVAGTTLGTVSDDTAKWTVTVESIRFEDATGAILTAADPNPSEWNKTGIGFRTADADDKLTVRSSSSNPKSSTLKVDEDDTSEAYTLSTHRFEAARKGSDLAIVTVPVKIELTNYTGVTGSENATALKTKTENVVDRLWIEIDGEEFEAKYVSATTTAGKVTAAYTVDVDEEFVLEAGDTVDVTINAEFRAQDTNYNVGLGVKASFNGDIEYEGEESGKVASSASGETHTLTLGTVEVSGVTGNGKTLGNTTKPGYISFEFTIKADDEDVTFERADIARTITGTDATTVSAGTLSKVSGDAKLNSGAYTINEGDSAKFSIEYVVTPVDAGDNGTYHVNLDSILGVRIDKSASVTVAF